MLPTDMVGGVGRQYSFLSSLFQRKTSVEPDQVAPGGGTDIPRPNVSGTSLGGTFLRLISMRTSEQMEMEKFYR